MRKLPRFFVVTVTIPFMLGCVATLVEPIPQSGPRPTTAIRGVILRNPESEERIEYRETLFVEWTDSTLAITGIVPAESQNMMTRTYRLSDVEAILVREVDVNRTSFLIAGVMVGVGVLSAVLFGGKTTSETVFEGGN